MDNNIRYDLYCKLKSSIDSEESSLNNTLNSLQRDENNLNSNISSKKVNYIIKSKN